MWRWGSFAMGVVGFVLLYWLMTLFGTLFLGWQRILILTVIATLLSLRSGRRWRSGREPDRSYTKTVHPTVAVEGKPGATYVLLEPAKGPKGGPRVKPEEFGPIWWAVYTIAVRAPVALGDAILTTFWRLGERFDPGASRGRNVGSEDTDFLNDLPDPARRQF